MSQERSVSRGDQRWAHFRFSVVGPLLAAPPEQGELQGELKRLAQKHWRHPITGDWAVFGASTIERWYYQALRSPKIRWGFSLARSAKIKARIRA